MYIAAPPDEMDMLNRVKLEIMKKLPTVQIYLSTQVKFSSLFIIYQNNFSCYLFWTNISKVRDAKTTKKIDSKFCPWLRWKFVQGTVYF